MRLIISDHAMMRWRERVGYGKYKKIKNLVMGNLLPQLRIGLDSNERGAFPLELFSGLVAMLEIDPAGYWVVTTFRRDEFTG